MKEDKITTDQQRRNEADDRRWYREQAAQTSKHTPGPWSFIAEEGQGCFVYTETATKQGDDLAEIIWRGNHGESVANARLIAAAPDLLAACKHALNLLETSGTGELNDLRVAIAKAIGH